MRKLAIIALVLLAGCKPGANSTGTNSVAGPGILGPSAAKEGVEWNHKELLTYLKGKGVKVEMRPSTTGSGLAFVGPEDFGVVVIRHQTADAAHDLAGRSKYHFSWGRFTFEGGTDMVINRIYLAIAEALGVKP